MNSLQIEYFLTLCKHKNYSETARRLYVSQPTVSKQIAALEEELGLKLFNRSKASIELTTGGEIMKEAFERSNEIINKAIDKAASIDVFKAGAIHFGFLEGPDFGPSIKSSLMNLKMQMNHAVFKFDFFPHASLNAMLENDEIDIAITLIEEVQNNKMIEYIPLRNLNHGIVVHESLPLAQSADLDPELIKKLPFFITFDGSHGAKAYVKRMCAELQMDESQLNIVPDINTQILNVEAGMGISALSLTPRISNNPALKFFPLNNIKITLVAAWHRDNSNEARKQLTRLIRKQKMAEGIF